MINFYTFLMFNSQNLYILLATIYSIEDDYNGSKGCIQKNGWKESIICLRMVRL